MKLDIYTQQGKKSGDITLPEEIFGIAINPNLVHQITTSQASNRRQNSAHTKDRSEVSGSGKKPWKQKGTGRARAGSKRSPLWRTGGITFGPRNERNYKKGVPTKMKKKALFMVLSGKAVDKELFVVDEFKFEKPNTKAMAEFLKTLPIENKSVLILTGQKNDNVIKSVANLPKVDILEARNINAYDALQKKICIVDTKAIEVLKETFLK